MTINCADKCQDSLPVSHDELLIEAKKKAEKIIAAAEAQARRRAQEILAETMETERCRIIEETKTSALLDARKTIDEAEEKAGEILEQARRKAELDAAAILDESKRLAELSNEEMRNSASAEANRIITEAEHRAKQIIKNADDTAKVESERILAEAHSKESAIIEKAGVKALQIVTEAEKRAKQIVKEARRHGKANVAAIESQAQNKTQLMAEIQTGKTKEEVNKATPQSQPEPKLNDNHANEGTNIVKSDDGDDNRFFQGDVELALAPPVRLDAMVVLHKQLKRIPNVEVLNVTGSVDKGITIRALAKSPTPLIKFIKELSLVTTAIEEDKQIPGNEARQEKPIATISITAQ